MKTTTYSERAFWGSRAKPVLPVREFGLTFPLTMLALILATFLFVMMRLQVEKAHYGSLIQNQTERVEALRAEVRALNGRLATETSLAAIRQRAQALGMTDPPVPPRNLVVVLNADEIGRMGGMGSSTVNELLARRWHAGGSQPPGEEGTP